MFKYNKDTSVLAREWIEKIHNDEDLEKSVKYSYENTDIVMDAKPLSVDGKNFDKTKTSVFRMYTQQAVRDVALPTPNRLCVLNFASFIWPGGAFMKGATTQEEALCHSSTLYPVLEKMKNIYEDRIATRKAHLDSAEGFIYTEDFLYSPRIMFTNNDYELGDYIVADVLTYAAPNARRYRMSKIKDPNGRNIKANEEFIENFFCNRMEIAFTYPLRYGVTDIILGAWGCGVFGNKAEFVAKKWKELTEKYNGCYRNVIHPVPDEKNYSIFKSILG